MCPGTFAAQAHEHLLLLNHHHSELTWCLALLFLKVLVSPTSRFWALHHEHLACIHHLPDKSAHCRSDEFAQQAASSIAAAPAEAAVYEAPPTGPPQHTSPQHTGGVVETASHDTMMAHHQTGKPGYAAAKNTSGLAEGEIGLAGSGAQPGPSAQQSALPDEAASPKGWCAAEKLLVATGSSCHAVLSPVLAADNCQVAHASQHIAGWFHVH